MLLINDSLTVVFVGDWNKLYIQPDWVAKHVYGKEEIEIGVNGQGSDFFVSYRSDGVIISPGQSRMLFSTTDTDNSTINNLCQCLNRFIEKAYTPQTFSYGINIEFIEENGIMFAEVLDAMSDTNAIVESGYEVISTKVHRALKSGDEVINMDSELASKNLIVSFNKHYAAADGKTTFNAERIKDFITECYRILSGLGYEIESDE